MMSNYELVFIGWTNVSKKRVRFDDRLFATQRSAVKAAEEFIENFESEYLDTGCEYGHEEDASWMFSNQPAFVRWIHNGTSTYPHYVIVREVPIHEYEL